MKLPAVIVIVFCFGGSSGAQEACMRYVTPYNYVRVCGTAGHEDCLTGTSSQCGNPQTLAICINKMYLHHDTDYNHTEKEKRATVLDEEGRYLDESNPALYECWDEGTCECIPMPTFDQCKSPEEHAFEEDQPWYELSPSECYGQG